MYRETDEAKRPRKWVALISVAAFLFMGTAPAVAEEVPVDPAPVEATPTPVEPGPEQAPPADPAPAPEAVQTPEPVPAPAPGPEATAPVTEESASPPPASGAQLAAPQSEAAAMPEPPYLRWRVIDSTGNPVGDTASTVQGVKDLTLVDDGGENQWAAALTATVADNTGQPDYAGLDLDPVAGSFLLKQLIDDLDTSRAFTIVAGDIYRIRPAIAPEGFNTSKDATWVEAEADASAEEPVEDLQLLETAELDEVSSMQAREAAPVEMSALASATPPQHSLGNGRLQVSKRGDRSGTSNTVNPLTGALFVAVASDSNNPATVTVPTVAQINANPTAYAYCTTGEGTYSSTPGQCILGVPNNGSRYWVFEVESPNGFSILDQLALGTVGGGGIGSTTKYRYAFRTGQITTTNIVNVPGTSTTTDPGNNTGVPQIPNASSEWRTRTGGWADVRNNGSFPGACGVKVAMVFDISSSISSDGNPSEMTKMLDAGKAFVSATTGLGGTPTTVSVFRFGSNASQVTAPGVTSPVSIATPAGIAQANTLINAVNNRGSSTQYTNWDDALRKVADAGTWDMVLMLTDGDPSRSGTASGNGTGYITLGYLEEAIASANYLKTQTGPNGSKTYILPVGIAMAPNSIENLQAISGPSDPVLADNFDALTAQLRQIALANCGGQLSVSKVVVDEAGNPLPLDPESVGWSMTVAGGATNPSTTKVTGASGGVSFPINFGDPVSAQTLTVSEGARLGYEFVKAECTNATVQGTPSNGSLTAVVNPATIASCVFTNKKIAQKGTLQINKAFGTPMPPGSGPNSVTFNGSYTCTQGEVVVASGTWSRTGTGTATLTPAVGGPAANQIPVGASCSATENPPSGGMPNSSWQWDTPSVSGPVVIVSNETKIITATNKAKRVFGNFEITKVVPSGSTADAENTYSGDWSCVLGEETTTGTWGPIIAGDTWSSTNDAEIPLGSVCSVSSEDRPEWPVENDHSYQWDGDPVFSAAVQAATNGLSNITVTNATKRVLGSVTWSKVAAGTSDLLKGSAWKIVGPVPAVTEIAITDCTSLPCDDADKDPAAGQFKLEGLAWGSYTVTETKAPPGYVGGASFTFTVDETNAGPVPIDQGAIENEQQAGVSLPLTGGLGRDFYTLLGFGTLLVAATALGLHKLRSRRQEV